MSIRLLVLALFVPLVLAGCTTQRDSADTEEPDVEEETDPEEDTPPADGLPNVSAYPYGTWDYSMTTPDGDETVTGLLTLRDDGTGHLTTSTGIDAPLTTQEVSLTGPSLLLDGTVQAEDPLAFSFAGSVQNDDLQGETTLDGVTYALTATRVQE